MNGIELEKAELAYLIATVGADGLIGVDDPKLMPSTDKAQATTFGKGRKQLEAGGWIKAIADQPGEYDLNAGLFHTVAVMAAPEMVVATSRGADSDDRQLVLHYLAREHVVELWAKNQKGYVIGRLGDRQALAGRLAEFLNVAESGLEGEFRLPEAAFQKLKGLGGKAPSAQSKKALQGAGLEGLAQKALLAALASEARGQLIVARTKGREIDAGRRAEVFGEQKGAWMAVRPEAEASEFVLTPVGASGLASLVDRWLNELGLPA